MPDMMAYAASPPSSQYNVTRLPVGTVSEKTSFLRKEFYEQNARRLRTIIDIVLEEFSAGCGHDELSQATDAMNEAISLVSKIEFGDLPWVGISDDSILSLQWQRDASGVLLTFAGDGVFGFAVKAGPQSSYSDEYAENEVAQGIPQTLAKQITRLSISVEATQTAA